MSFAGSLTSSFKLAPAVAIAIDVTHSTDYPGANKKSDDEVRVGGGPVLSRGASLNPKVYEGMRDASKRLGFNLPVQGAARSSGTDADAMIRSGAGTATGLISIPNRYMHSPNEVISLSDVENAARVIASLCERSWRRVISARRERLHPGPSPNSGRGENDLLDA